jgi:O-antigen/teichoic acid export membrane protein
MKRVAGWGAVIGVQAAGSVATLASVTLIARMRGAEIQGNFALVKAEVDLLVAFLLLGMPQAIFYFLTRGALAWPRVWRITIAQAAIAGLVALTVLVQRNAWQHQPVGILAAGVAVAALVMHGNLRGGLLCVHSPLVFSAITALPGLCLLFGVSATLAAGEFMTAGIGQAALVLAATTTTACLATAWVSRQRGFPTGEEATPLKLRELIHYGVATWVPAVGQTLSPVIALNWVRGRLDDPIGVGVFSAALLAINLLLTPFAMIVPLLFKRWMAVGAETRRAEMRRVAAWLAPSCLGFALLILWLEQPVVGRFFGPEYVSRGAVFAVMAIAIWPQTVNRLLGVSFSAEGWPWLAVVGEGMRVAALVLGLLVFKVHDLPTLALVWVCAEMTAPLLGWLTGRLVRRDRNAP